MTNILRRTEYKTLTEFLEHLQIDFSEGLFKFRTVLIKISRNHMHN
jgi:hypothetical protein